MPFSAGLPLAYRSGFRTSMLVIISHLPPLLVRTSMPCLSARQAAHVHFRSFGVVDREEARSTRTPSERPTLKTDVIHRLVDREGPPFLVELDEPFLTEHGLSVRGV